MESDDAILALAVCACGHGIGRHDDDGCPGSQATFCVCTLTPAAALDAAIERVRHTSLAICGSSGLRPVDGSTFDAEKMAAELNSDDYEFVGPVRALAPATMIALLAPQLIRPQ
jgi:hypothetical protein